MFGFIPNLGLPELTLIFVLALILFGPGKLPDVGRALGKTIREFKVAIDSPKVEVANDSNEKEIKG